MPKGTAKALGTLCAKLEAAKSKTSSRKRGRTSRRDEDEMVRSTTTTVSSRDRSRGTKKKSAKKRSSKKSSSRGRSTRRDASYMVERDHTRGRSSGRTGIRRPTVRSATGPWVIRDMDSERDPAWFGEPRRHATAAKKGVKNSSKRKTGIRRAAKKSGNKKGRRDPSWFGEPERHSSASRFGWGERFGQRNILTHEHPLRPAGERDSAVQGRDPAWYGESERHAFSAEKGWRRVAKPGWTPKRYNPKDGERDPNYFGSHSSMSRAKGRRPTKSRHTAGRARNSSGQFVSRGRRDY